MFTIEHIQAAHSRVKSGADFPNYIKKIQALGVTHYETHVSDGRTDCCVSNNYRLNAPAKYSPLSIAEEVNVDECIAGLKSHQQGKTDYFCQLFC